jgi:hypothetical protein
MNNELNDNNNKIVQPNNLNIKLKEHQKTIIYRMNKLEYNGKINTNDLYSHNETLNKYIINTNMGILSDISGSGKKISIIGLICFKKIPRSRNNYIEGSKYLCIKKKNNSLINVNLIVTSKISIYKWVNDIKHISNIKYKIINNKKDIEIINKDYLNNIDIIIISDNNFIYLYNKFVYSKWGRIIIDYPENIILPKICFSCFFLWFITNTPYNLLYSKKPYILNIFKTIMPNAFKYIIVKNNNDYVKDSIKLPKIKKYNILCSIPDNISEILYIKNNINHTNVEESINNLNLYIDNKDNIYNKIVNNITNNKSIINDKYQKRLINIKNNIYNDDVCPICLDKKGHTCIVSCCNNILCINCLLLSFREKKNCPFCRTIIKREHICIFNNNININNSKKNKIDSLINILKKKKKKNKIIMFINNLKNDIFLKKITQEIIQNTNFKIIVLNNKKNIKNILNIYTNYNSNIILFINKLNYNIQLKETTDIIFFHNCNKNTENGIINIAQKIGRVKKLNIYYLVNIMLNDIYI